MTISQNKKVSVVIPNYNYAKYIEKRIDSIIKQTYPIYELIILDDCSTDESIEVIERKMVELKRTCPNLRLKFVRNEKNSGKAIKQWERGFELADGDYVWIAEADDLCSRRFLEEVMKGFEDSEVVLSYSESMIINNWGLIVAPNFRWSRDKEKTGHYKKSYVKSGRREIEEIMAIRCTIPNVSAVVFKKDKKYLKYLNEALKYTQVGDWYFYIKVLENGNICYNYKALNRFRVHGGSVTNKTKNSKRHFDEIKDIHRLVISRFDLDRSVMDRIESEENRIEKVLI